MILFYNIFIFIFVFCVTPVMLSINVSKAFLETRKLCTRNILRCLVPIYNTFYTRKMYNGKAQITAAMLISSTLLIMARLVVIVFLSESKELMMYSAFGIQVGVAMLWITTGYVYYSLAKICDNGFIVKLLCFIVPPVAAYWIGTCIIPVVNRILFESRNITLD